MQMLNLGKLKDSNSKCKFQPNRRETQATHIRTKENKDIKHSK